MTGSALSEWSHQDFQSKLMDWFDINARVLPWRESKDPYQIWLSEIILQQTRIDQGLPYFHLFLERFPSVDDLASASIDDILRAWEGLGYYSRARNLHKAAKQILSQHGGKLPRTYLEWLTLPGVGPYTAAAVSSIAFGEKEAVLDGNVARVLSRVFAFEGIAQSSSGRKHLHSLASDLLNRTDPGRHNEAMMELGALVCKARNPSCGVCPVANNCQARLLGQVHEFPRKRPPKSVPHFDISVAIIRDDQNRILIQRRPEDAMLGGLWEFPGGKNEKTESFEETCIREVREELAIEVETIRPIVSIKHAYSHFRITLHAFECRRTSDAEPTTNLPLAWVLHEELANYAFPRANRKLLEIMSDEEARQDGTLSQDED